MLPNIMISHPGLHSPTHPASDPHTVFHGGAGIIYDHTVVSAIQYQQTQFNYLFKNSVNQPLGVQNDAYTSLQHLARFNGLTSAPAPPQAPSVTPPYTPWVQNAGTANPFPYGLINGEFNETVDPHSGPPTLFCPPLGCRQLQQDFGERLHFQGRLRRALWPKTHGTGRHVPGHRLP